MVICCYVYFKIFLKVIVLMILLYCSQELSEDTNTNGFQNSPLAKTLLWRMALHKEQISKHVLEERQQLN